MLRLQLRRVGLVLAVFALATTAQAAEVAGVRIEDRIQAGGQELVLNGAGIRTRFFVKVYVGALYAAQKSSQPAALIDQPGPRRMLLRLLRDLDADTLHGALEEGLRNNLTTAELGELRPQIDQLGALMRGIGTAKEGDIIALDVGPQGVEISQNAKTRGRIDSAALGRALLKVWLGDNPVDSALKKALLGG